MVESYKNLIAQINILKRSALLFNLNFDFQSIDDETRGVRYFKHSYLILSRLDKARMVRSMSHYWKVLRWLTSATLVGLFQPLNKWHSTSYYSEPQEARLTCSTMIYKSEKRIGYWLTLQIIRISMFTSSCLRRVVHSSRKKLGRSVQLLMNPCK